MNRKPFVWIVGVACFVATQTNLFAQLDYLPSIQKGTIAVRLKPIATGMSAPLYGINPPGDTNRLFVLEQNGLVRIIQNGSLLPGSALNLQSLVQMAPVGTGPLNAGNANDERGLLGLAFHPGYNTPSSVGFRTLYTYTSEALSSPTFPAPAGATQNYMNLITEWKISAADPNVVDPASRRPIISFGKNAGNHNGGTIAFGPDGNLYLALGDGGNANDVGASHIEPGGNAQNLTTPLGKMIRIDPINPSLTGGSPNPASSNSQYRIPTDNPYTGVAGAVQEIFAIGLRNPYRYAFDTATGDLILADVGQNNIEEIDRITKGGNYGWAMKEGTFLFNRTDGTIGPPPGNNSPGSPAGLIDPISNGSSFLQYDHQDGISITGGFVYRGSAIPELVGKYIFGDLALTPSSGGNPRIDGRLFYADLQTAQIREFLIPQFANDKLPNGLTVHGFGQDANGELYAMVTNTPPNGTGGIVYQFVPVPEPGSIALTVLATLIQFSCGRRRLRQ
jgi:glucose/arabinose dehydrogenase